MDEAAEKDNGFRWVNYPPRPITDPLTVEEMRMCWEYVKAHPITEITGKPNA